MELIVNLLIILLLTSCLYNESKNTNSIDPNDLGSISISIEDYNIVENDSGYVEIYLPVKLSENAKTSFSLNCQLDEISAEKNEDFSMTEVDFLVSKGSKNIDIGPIRINGDLVYEADESFKVVCRGGGAVDLESSKYEATVVILNDDAAPEISISDASNYEMSNIDFEITLSNPSDEEIVLDYIKIASGSAVPSLDYDSTPGKLVLAPGNTSYSLSVFATYDEIDESDESFSVQISSVNDEIVFTDDTAIGTIVDNNGLPIVNFDSSEIEVYETQSSIEIKLNLNQVSGRDLNIPIVVISNDLDLGEYDGIPATIHIAEGDLSGSGSFSIYDDYEVEASENIILQIDSSYSEVNIGSIPQMNIKVAESDSLPENLNNLQEKGIGFYINGQYYKDQLRSTVLGDIDGDGIEEFVVYNNNSEEPNIGARHFFFWGKNSRYTENINLTPEISDDFPEIRYYSDSSLDPSELYYRRMYDLNCDGYNDFYLKLDWKVYVIEGGEARHSATDFSFVPSGINGPVQKRFLPIGDINSDGCEDMFYGIPAWESDISDGTVLNQGFASITYGSNNLFAPPYSGPLDIGPNGSDFSFSIKGVNHQDRVGVMYQSRSLRVGDVNNDGFDDVYLSAGGSNVYLLWGSDSLISSFEINNYSSYGVKLKMDNSTDVTYQEYSTSFFNHPHDFNSDGIADIFSFQEKSNTVTQALGRNSWTDSSSLEDNFLLYNSAFWQLKGGEGNFSISVDIDADGYDDLIFAMPTDDFEPEHISTIFIKFGSTFSASSSVLASVYDHKIFGEKQGWNLSKLSAGDFNGDGIMDLILDYSDAFSTSLQAGRIYVIYGGDLNGKADYKGTDLAETINATSADEIILAFAGDDVVFSNGGIDYINLGAGDDSVTVPDTNFRKIDGGPGFDTVILDSINLDLSITNLKYQNLEAIDLKTSASSQSLSIGNSAVLNLNTFKKLYIKASPNDSINLTGATGVWSASGSETKESIHYTRYIHATSSVVVYVETGAMVVLP